jgi:hypothetical protein
MMMDTPAKSLKGDFDPPLAGGGSKRHVHDLLMPLL